MLLKVMRYLIINLTRFGDLLQMQPLIHTLYGEGHEVGLICLKNFEEAALLLDKVEVVFSLPGAQILSNLHDKWEDSLLIFENFVSKVYESFLPDVVVNLTAILSARLLAKKLTIYGEKALPGVGFFLDKEGFNFNTNGWASYIQAVTLQRLSSPYNLSDGFSLMVLETYTKHKLGSQEILQSSLEEKERGKIFLDNLSLGGMLEIFPVFQQKKYIGFQLGASAKKRQWSIKYFADLSKILYENGYIPLLLGSKGDIELGAEFYKQSGIGKNAIGKTDLKTLRTLLEEVKLLVTNDTGTMHLGASLKLPIIGLFHATAQPWDTGPISEDACLLEPKIECHPCNFSHICQIDFQCCSCISPKLVWQILKHRLENNSWPQIFSQEARIWKSLRDENSFLNLIPLDSPLQNSRSELFSMQRAVYKELIEVLQNTKTKEEIYIPPCLSIDIKVKLMLIEALNKLEQYFLLLTQQGKLLTQVAKMPTAFLNTHGKILEIFQETPYLMPLKYMWQYGTENFTSDISQYLDFISKVGMVLKHWHQALK